MFTQDQLQHVRYAALGFRPGCIALCGRGTG